MPEPEVGAPPDLAPPVVDDVPPIGPVARVFPAVAPVGAGTVNYEDGFSTGVGEDVGIALGRAVGGAGFAGDGLFTLEGC